MPVVTQEWHPDLHARDPDISCCYLSPTSQSRMDGCSFPGLGHQSPGPEPTAPGYMSKRGYGPLSPVRPPLSPRFPWRPLMSATSYKSCRALLLTSPSQSERACPLSVPSPPPSAVPEVIIWWFIAAHSWSQGTGLGLRRVCVLRLATMTRKAGGCCVWACDSRITRALAHAYWHTHAHTLTCTFLHMAANRKEAWRCLGTATWRTLSQTLLSWI